MKRPDIVSVPILVLGMCAYLDVGRRREKRARSVYHRIVFPKQSFTASTCPKGGDADEVGFINVAHSPSLSNPILD